MCEFCRIVKFVTEDREAKKAERNAAKMEKYKEKIKAAELQKEIEEKKKAEEAEQERIRLEAEAAKKKDHKAQLNATKKQRKILRQLAKSHDYWVDDDKKIAMMEDIEFLCANYKGDRLTGLNERLSKMEIHEQPDYVVREVKREKAEQDAKWVKS